MGSPLLALPAELRNRIYELLFEDTSPPAVNILAITTHAPPSAITQTSQQLRAESLLQYRSACTAFWPTHTYELHLREAAIGAHNDNLWPDTPTPSMARKLTLTAPLTFAPRIKRLTVQIAHPCGTLTRIPLRVAAPLTVVQTNARPCTLPGNHDYDSLPFAAFQGRISLYRGSYDTVIDVYGVLRVLCLLRAVDQPAAWVWLQQRGLGGW
ncbi:hypothetical protein LTR08_001515 [Meristemomyces frigidus]|nr:hypothetical protein LTR08_001515 [Meristemomyces frigidus]